MEAGSKNLAWWQREIIYQVYPRSFQDSNGDGIGDLPGIVQRLDYLKWLGVGVIWLSPIFPSPMIDFGYDISDYRGIDSIFGTSADFDILVSEVHSRGMKLILDFVPNHTSDQHPWFLESRSSRNNPKRAWYIWKDAREGRGYPNNWLASFGGSAWEWDERTQQYYYHAYDRSQPDLNWRNPDVKSAMFDVMRFWLDRGVDGFRVDVMWHLIKDKQFRDNPPNPDYDSHMSTVHQLLPLYSTDQPEVHHVVQSMRRVLDEYDDRMMIGEIYLPVNKLVTYYGPHLNGAHLPFNFQLISLPWEASEIASGVVRYEAALPAGAWPNWVLSNHDRPRIRSRVGAAQAFIAAMLLLTLRGTITLYYGDEIGMRDAAIPPEWIQDPRGLNMPDKNLSRDPSRTPMQWNDSPNAGFTKGTPWLPLDRLYRDVNVARQQQNAGSMLSFYHRIIELRRCEKAFSDGQFTLVSADNQLLSYRRQCSDGPAFLVALNLSHRPCYFRPPSETLRGVIEISCVQEHEGIVLAGIFTLEADEGIIVRLTEN